MGLGAKIKNKIVPVKTQETATPDRENVENLLEKADVEKKKELARIIEMMFLQSFQAGEKSASIQGTKRDKVYLLTMINTIATAMLIVLFIVFQFYM